MRDEMSETKALDEILKVAKTVQFPFEMVEQAAAELTHYKEAVRLLNLAVGVMSFEDLGKIPGIRKWIEGV